jgi:myotubularin-related protein 1/2
VGAMGQRCFEDERLFEFLSMKDNNRVEEMVVFDARSWVAANANMLNGKGTENIKWYRNIELVFLDIDNIHKVRDSYK